ncbi:MAG TPA: hypothetical protein VHN14_14470 [Kofleriaceae bacterium]|nr:hypothetical protein [Kofleriaceae bacterium]
MRWLWRGSALTILLIGWVFIAWQNHFHVTAPLVFVCLGYLAVVATVYNLWRTGAAVVASPEEEADSTWAKPAGALGELEREKRTLIKAIKEAEFDHQMGKLSQRDADDMIRSYRARAVEVLKEIDRIELGSAGSAREQILREVRARLEIEAKSHKKAAGEPKPSAKPEASEANHARGKKKKPLAQPEVPRAEAKTTVETDAAASPKSEAISEATEEVAHKATDAAADDAADDDDAMDADSTTAAEPRREEPAKEATP